MKIAIDFDGTIIERTGFPRKLNFLKDKPTKGCLDAVSWLISEGHEIYILTARTEEEFSLVKDWLDNNNFPSIEITNKKKPGTRLYIDDRSIRFTNWLDICKYIG
jgi:hypothetical protein